MNRDEPPMQFDGSWKYGLESLFENAMRMFPGVHDLIDWSYPFEFQDKELAVIAGGEESGIGIVDKLIKVRAKDGQELTIIIHIEVQSQRRADFADRMYLYNYRIHDRYRIMPLSLAILGDDDPNWLPVIYRRKIGGCWVEFGFPYFKLIDYHGREAELEASDNPFAMIVLAHLKTLETRGNQDSRMSVKRCCRACTIEVGIARGSINFSG